MSHILIPPTLPPGDHFAGFMNSGYPVFCLSSQNVITQVFKKHLYHFTQVALKLYNVNYILKYSEQWLERDALHVLLSVLRV